MQDLDRSEPKPITGLQQTVIDRITKHYRVAEITNCSYFVSILFDNGYDGVFAKVDFHCFIGRRGKLTFKTVHSIGSDKEHLKILAKLVGATINWPIHIELN